MTPSGRPAASSASASIIIVTGPSGAGLSTTVQPAASAGEIFSEPVATGPFHGTTTATTPMGSRTILPCPPFQVRSSSNAKRSWNVAASSHMSTAFWWNRVETAAGAPSSRVKASAISGMRFFTSFPTRTRISARSAGVIRGQGPSSNALRAAATARSMSASRASGTVAMTSPLIGEITSITASLDGSTHDPPMNSLS
ncbi:hypothetical protein AIIKEEIJ_00858 [Rhodococcus sp. YH1]|nr:hypothetical protein [Rhodococcus sp. YH1]